MRALAVRASLRVSGSARGWIAHVSRILLDSAVPNRLQCFQCTLWWLLHCRFRLRLLRIHLSIFIVTLLARRAAVQLSLV